MALFHVCQLSVLTALAKIVISFSVGVTGRGAVKSRAW